MMRVADLMNSFRASAQKADGWYLSTATEAVAIGQALQRPARDSLLLLIGPEGGWTSVEMQSFDAAGLIAVSLTQTTLRVETAAVAVAAVVASLLPGTRG